MHFTLATAAAALLAAGSASAANITVKVGSGGLHFDPPSVTAASGDFIQFQFQAGTNHSVTQSTFAVPCSQMMTPSMGVDSGFMPVETGAASLPAWTISVNDTTPLWFFCKQTNPAVHCAKGMVFAVNPTAAKSFDAFQTAANATGTNSTSSTPAASASGSGAAASPSTTKSGAIRIGGSAAAVLSAAAIFIGLL